MTPHQREHAHRLYATTSLSASNIAARVGVTKNAVIGAAHRGEWSRPEGKIIPIHRPSRVDPAPIETSSKAERMAALARASFKFTMDRVARPVDPRAPRRSVDPRTIEVGWSATSSLGGNF